MPKLLFLIHFLLFQSVAHADSTLVKQVNLIAQSVKETYAADKRTAFFEGSVNPENNSVRIETTEKKSIEAFKAQLEARNIRLQVFADLLPADNLKDSIFGVANLSVTNNRAAPHHAAELTTQMLLGTPVEILKAERGYYLVRTPDKYLSWVDRAGVARMDQQEMDIWKRSKKVVFTADYGHSLATRSKSAERVSDLVQGDILRVAGRSGKYYKVIYPDRRIAFVPRKSMQQYEKWIKRPDPDSEQILKTAATLMGVPYLWGGTSVKGVDCSGFTKISYFLNGIIIPRDASQQALVGQQVDIFEQDTLSLRKALANLRAGDLLFFATVGKDAANNPRVTHTAIYMGNGQFIQSAGRVKTNSLIPGSPNFDAYHKNTLVGARRILSAIGDPEISRVNEHPGYMNQ